MECEQARRNRWKERHFLAEIIGHNDIYKPDEMRAIAVKMYHAGY